MLQLRAGTRGLRRPPVDKAIFSPSGPWAQMRVPCVFLRGHAGLFLMNPSTMPPSRQNAVYTSGEGPALPSPVRSLRYVVPPKRDAQ